jgi:hypothetical protein
MKKGCFIKTVIIGTILIAVIVYVIENKLNDWVIKPGKQILLKEINKDWDVEFNYIHASPQKDSLKNLLNYYLVNIDSLSDFTPGDEKSFISELKSAIKDSIISNEELSNLTLLVKKEINEKSKSNRN